MQDNREIQAFINAKGETVTIPSADRPTRTAYEAFKRTLGYYMVQEQQIKKTKKKSKKRTQGRKGEKKANEQR